jgi:hypothetical protein
LHLVHSHIKRFRGVHCLPSSNLKPLNFLHQCIVKSYIKSETIFNIIN